VNRRAFGLLLVAASLLAGCTSRLPLQAPTSVGGIDAILAANPMPEEANIHPVLVSRSAAMSRHLIRIRDREQPHVHAEHDLVVFIVRGKGVLHVDGAAQPVAEGSIAVIDRGIAHWFENTGPEPAAAFVVFSPPYDGADNVPVDYEESTY
jgi:quercetin dioxygenase-like cupin family protein